MGVTYYKLEQRYEGDKTKGCGLTTAEMDENFHFLRGYDIKDAWLADDGTLILERVNCDRIVVSGIPEFVKSIAEETMEEYDVPFSLSGTSYDSRTGTLTIMVNGEPYDITGFEDTDLEFKLYVGYGLDGNGTIANPVRVSHVNDTGFYAPVERVLEEGEELPSTNVSGSRRYITKERKSVYGLVYDAETALKIDEWLKENARGWRVPTFDDWNEMLNALECNDEDRNHGDSAETSDNGAIAATLLKAEEFGDDPELNEFNAYPTQIRVGTPVTSFWSRTPDDRGAIYAKELQKNRDTVLNRRSGIDDLDVRAIRLIKDAEYNSFEDEEIGGSIYKTTPMDAYKDGHVYATKIWLAENLSLDGVDGIEGVKPYGSEFYLQNEEDYDKTSYEHFFLNVWDSFDKKYIKKELHENDVLVINDFDGSGNPQEVIIRTDENGNHFFEPHFKDIYETIDSLSAGTENALSAITSEIEALSAGTENADSELAGKINELSAATENAVAEINGAVNSLSSLTAEAVSDLQEQIDAAVADGIRYDEEDVQLSDGVMTITSNDNNKTLTRNFHLDMGSISLSELAGERE